MGGKHSKMISIEIDFSAQPTSAENSYFNDLDTTSKKSIEILEKMTNYKAKESEIRSAIATPSPETEEAAWKAIIPQVQIINSFFEYSREMKKQFVNALKVICQTEGTETVLQFQASSIRLMDIIDFAIQFDNKKLTNPGLQNDFSYYRRSVGKMKQKHREDVTLRDDVTNQISMFFAFSNPMVLCLCEALNEDLKSGMNLDNLSAWLKTVANVCCLEAQKQGANGIKMLRVMTGCCLLFDAVVPLGAFNPKSKFNMIDMVRTLQAVSHEECALLLNALKYSTKHFNDDETPKNIKVLLM